MYYVVSAFAQPMPLVFLLLGVAIINLWRSPQDIFRRIVSVTLCYLLALASCMPVVADVALASLESRYSPLETLPDDVGAIVVLSGGVYRSNGVRTRDELDASTIYRCLEGARLFRQNRAIPMLLTGGKVHPNEPGEPYAQVMREFLLSIGIPDAQIIVETHSRSTYENGVFSAKLLKDRAIDRIVLVTEATHMLRSEKCFSRQNLQVVPAGCRYRARAFEWKWQQFVPSPGAALSLFRAAHEWTGLAYYRFKDRL